ncbi:MAG: HD domain-containing phosphohydrolase [Acidobacteriota bacterium]
MEKEKILIVDDEETIRELLLEFLEGQGYECVTASNAEEALKIFKGENNFSLLITDIRMPGKSGLELLKELKEIDPHMGIIMMSALKDINIAIDAMTLGAYDYVIKPFKLSEVVINVKRGLEKRRLVLENLRYQKHLEEMVEERTNELKKALEELNETYNETLNSLILALDFRDTETHGHSNRVTEYAIKIAESYGIEDKDELITLRRAALLHDIGKIAIPDYILRKPEKLSPEEWETMKTHSEIGYNMMRKVKFLQPASIIVLYHHENYDGTGYPYGKKNDEIPLGARIFAVADALDALTSDRPYRKAYSFEYAREEIKKNSGTQFDPKIIEAFLSVDLEVWKKISEEIQIKLSKT